VLRIGKDPRHGRLADLARAREEIGVVKLAVREGVAERTHHVLLPDEILEPSGPPLDCKNGVAHWALGVLAETGAPEKEIRVSPTPAPDRAATAAPFRA